VVRRRSEGSPSGRAGGSGSPKRGREGAREFTGNRQLLTLLVGMRRQRHREQRRCIDSGRSHRSSASDFDDLAEIHDREAVADIPQDRDPCR